MGSPRLRRPAAIARHAGARPLHLLVALLIVLGAAAGVRAPVGGAQDATPAASPVAVAGDGVTTITGTLALSNPLILSTISQPYVLLLDMTAYVQRDRSLPPSPRSQIAAPFEGSLAEGATFALNLPIAPQGTVNDLSGGEGGGEGVQLYSVEFIANAVGEPFLGPYEGGGWGTALSSLVTTVGPSDVVGGTVAVWAPDDAQLFPTGLGPDGIFLTEDDPVGPIPAGWTVVDLDADTFAQIRAAETEVEIVEGDDGFTDYGDRTFTEAFDELVAELEARYVFTDLKGIDWDALRAEYRPRVEEAEAADDLLAFNLAMVDFGLEFNDGHVSASIPPEYIAENIGGRLGMRLAETEDGETIVISVTEGLPADLAGIELGAVVTTWDGAPIAEAVAAEPLLFSVSTDFGRELQQYEFLSRGPLGETVAVGFQNPGGEEQSADLTFSEDIEGRDMAANGLISDENTDFSELPVDVQTLDSGLGYVRVNTFFSDALLMNLAWDAALNNLLGFGVPGLIIDLRDNGGGDGGVPLYFAGAFYDEPFELFQDEFLDENGQFIEVGSSEVLPGPVQWDLPVAVLIDESCASACEIFVAAMAEDPDNLIVGYTPTAGVEAGVYFWNLPGDVGFQASIVRVVRDGQVYIEGTGVPPNVEVPRTADNLLNPEDEVLAAAEEALGPAIEAALAEAEGQAPPAAEASPAAEGTPGAEGTPAA